MYVCMYVYMYVMYVRMYVCTYVPCIPDSHPHRVTSTKCRINTVVYPDDGHIVARNLCRLINILRINCAPSWLYLQVGKYEKMKLNLKSRLHMER